MKAGWKQLMQMKTARKQLESGFYTEMGAAWKQLGSSLEAAFILRAASKLLPGLLEPLSFWERQAAPKYFRHGGLWLVGNIAS